MATQPPIPPRNGESLNLAIGSKSIGITTRDLIPLLLLVAGCVGGYLIFVALDGRITTLTERQERILTAAAAHKDAVIEAMHAQRDLLVEAVHAAEGRRAVESAELRRLLQTHDFNMGRVPGEHLPLNIPPEMLGPLGPRHPVGP
jgi:hypothetical protein